MVAGKLISENFHRTKKSAAVLKHAIIDQYATPFASKTGSTSRDRRVAFIDGYAGAGRYDSGEEGSAAMLLNKAKQMAGSRRVECYFVEGDRKTAKKLRQVVTAEGKGVACTVENGDISRHLPTLLESVRDIPLFVYLDPCGLIIPLNEVAHIFERPGGAGAPATEVLINLTAHLRRLAGKLTSDIPTDKSREASLKRMDGVFGGDWWRAVWSDKCPGPMKRAPEKAKTAAEEAVVAGYAERLREFEGVGTWTIGVRPRADLKPVYYLVFATRHSDGLPLFGESASLGLKAWRKHQAGAAAENTASGADGSWETSWKAEEKALDHQWIDTLAERITHELEEGKPFRIMDRAETVLGGLAGVVRDLHLRAAIKKVRAAGRTSTDPKGRFLLNLLIRPS
ncbi:three-Cys-motif partner protein TcmP [Glycomyces sp. NPDC049804]|uniref:three-Cys-motif partner protein TcmP n=1 Tax=Glycomyces sp. NPDC049804 TaxID=3154363 RepID=UPI00342CBA98